MGAIRFVNNLICTLGCLAVVLALEVLLWLPTRPWVRLQINLSADAQPIALTVTGYEALMLANGVAVGPQKAAALIAALNSADGGSSLLSQYELGERMQAQILGLAGPIQQFGAFVLPYQIAFFVLPALALYMALVVVFTRGYFGQQLLKGLLLMLLTTLSVALTVGTMLFLNERINAVISASLAQNAAGFPGLGVGVNDALPEMRVGLQNLIDTRTPVIAGVVALVGSIVALLGACLAARKPGLTPRQIARAAMAGANLPSGNPNEPAPTGPPQPTQRLAPAPVPESQPVVAEPQSTNGVPSHACATCGQPVVGSEKFCRSCGARLSG